MSLIFNDVFKTVEISGAIATVGGITVSDEHSTMTFSVNYRTASAEYSNNYNNEFYSCGYDSSGPDIVTQAYSHLKTIGKFSNSSDS